MKDSKGEPLIGASILKASGGGTVTDDSGNFSLDISNEGEEIVISYTGFKPVTRKVSRSDSYLDIVITESVILSELTVAGSRFSPRTSISSPVPIDNIKDG